jgi:hypothetical protein
MRETGNTYRILAGKRFGRQLLRPMRTRWKDNVAKIGSENMRWMKRAQDNSISGL